MCTCLSAARLANCSLRLAYYYYVLVLIVIYKSSILFHLVRAQKRIAVNFFCCCRVEAGCLRLDCGCYICFHLSSLIQWICPSSEPSISADILQLLKEFTITSLVIDSQASFTHWRQITFSGGFILPATV